MQLWSKWLPSCSMWPDASAEAKSNRGSSSPSTRLICEGENALVKHWLPQRGSLETLPSGACNTNQKKTNQNKLCSLQGGLCADAFPSGTVYTSVQLPACKLQLVSPTGTGHDEMTPPPGSIFFILACNSSSPFIWHRHKPTHWHLRHPPDALSQEDKHKQIITVMSRTAQWLSVGSVHCVQCPAQSQSINLW